MPVDYSRFKDVQDSDEEPVLETASGKAYKGLSRKALAALEKAAQDMKGRQCYCFIDFMTCPEQLEEYKAEFLQSGVPVPTSPYMGRVVVHLDQAQRAPRLCENFRSLCTGERGTGVGGKRLHYKGVPLRLVLPKYSVQLSITNEYSCWGTYLKDEDLHIPGVSFNRPGVVAVGNHGPDTNTCSFMLLLNEAPELDGHNQIIGHVVQGMDVLRVIEAMPTDRKERSFAEKNVKTWWGGKPTVDIVVDNCGELPAESVASPLPADGDTFPEHAIDCTCTNDYQTLFGAQDKIREIGNQHYKAGNYKAALEKYKKAQRYLEPLLREQHLGELADQDVGTWLAGGLRPYDRTAVVRADLTISLNVCQVLLALQEWRAAIAAADAVVLQLVGRNSRKGNGTFPNDPLLVKALFRRAKALVGLSGLPGEVSRLEEALEALGKALLVEPGNKDVLRELAKVQAMQREADAAGRRVYQGMLQTANGDGTSLGATSQATSSCPTDAVVE